ncbi:transcriptional regulator [Dokdonella sp.]|uniref:winged helix-turn-helix domain-containing protein n=1 Tax=Dokdonella sp. TaxID=2291710 RepID=UPI001B25AF97|nr:transcriptional regulator [Dokdonella sp.]MBO9661597.1 transcriptional regulator [Dokdonella sp.]
MARLLYRFGDCSVDPAARELRRAGAPTTLSPKVFDVLAYLIDHRDRAVGRDELIAAVWGRVDVSDALLGQVVLKARRAIGDTGEEQHAIRTIPRFGYRWVAEVEVEERADPPRTADADATPSPPVETEAIRAVETATGTAGVAPTPARAARSRVLLAAAILALLAIASAAYVLGRRAAPPASTDAAQALGAEAIAVLPVEVDAAAEWSWLRLGLMDLLAERLRGAGLAVVPNETMVALMRGAVADAASFARAVRAATGARRLLVSGVQRSANGWRVRLELREPGADDVVVEAQQADAAAAARAAAAQLLMRLGKPVAADADAATPALDDVRQRAEAALLSDELDRARAIIETAPPELRDAPKLRLRLAQVDFRSGRMAAAREKLDRLLADVSAERDPVLRALVLTVSSSVMIHLGDTAAAGRDCREAVALLAERNEPGVLGRAHTACGIAEAVGGRFDEAMSDFAKARVALEITGDALSLARIEANEGLMENTRGRYAEGLAIMRRSEERFRRLGGRNEMMMAIDDEIDSQLALLQPVEALATSERSWALLPQISNADLQRSLKVQHARALAANGRLGEAAALLVEIADAMTPGQDLPVLGHARAEQARIELATGRAQAASGHARAAVEALSGPDRARARAGAWLTLVRALRASARDDDAAAEAKRLLDWSASVQVPAAAVLATLAEAERQWAGQRASASAAYERALAQAERGGIPADVAEVAVSWGNALIDVGDTERASTVVGRVQRWADADFPSSVVQARLYRALGRDEAWRGALLRSQRLAGERVIPPEVAAPVLAAPGGAIPNR